MFRKIRTADKVLKNYILTSLSLFINFFSISTLSIERLPERSFKTPFLLFNNPNLSKEVIEITGLNLLSDFGISLPVSTIEQMENPLKLFKKGISEFVGLKECLTFITLKNSSELTPTGHHEKGSLPIWRRAGKLNLHPKRFMNIIEFSNADFYITLADGDTFRGCSKKRRQYEKRGAN